MFLVVVSLVFVLAVFWCSLHHHGRSCGCAEFAASISAAGILFGCVISPLIMILSMIMFALSAIWLLVRTPSAYFGVFALMVLGGFVGWICLKASSRYAELARIKSENPLVSIAPRLEYERTRVEGRNRQFEPTGILQLHAEVEDELSEFERRVDYGPRMAALRSLHNGYQEDFIRAAGFGNYRMRRLSTSNVELPIAKARLLANPNPDSLSWSATPPPPIDQLKALHNAGLHDFLDPEKMGYVLDRSAVAGFEPHFMSEIPRPEISESEIVANEMRSVDQHRKYATWSVTRLQLVSLLKFDQPAVYVHEGLPQMRELGGAPTRPLSEFEQLALEKLRMEIDLVTDSAPGRVRLAGALRAGNDCLRCHHVERGALLGVFSYELRPAGGRHEPSPTLDAF